MTKRLLIITAVAALLATIGLAGIRSEGKYSGVVIFDRWGGCTLYSGIYVMYISEAVKEQLRPQAGKCVQLNATQVEQPHNPGDGLIKKFDLLGPAPAAKEWESPEGLKIIAVRAFEDGEVPAFTIRVENASDTPRTIRTDALAPTVLAAKTKDDLWGPSDGPSTAVVTRQAFWIDGDDIPRLEGANETWQWKVVKPSKLEKEVVLQPKAYFELCMSLRLPLGQYDFLAGYGGGTHDGQCIASNLIAFDVKEDGKAAVAKVAGR